MANLLQEQTAFMNSLLEQQLSIEEGLHTHEDLQRYLNKVCFKLELAGYEFPDKFTIPQFIEGLETLIAEDKRLEEEGHKPFLQRAVGAVKGAMSRGLAALPAAAHNKLRKYHAAKADAAMDAGNEKAYVHHYQAQHFHLKHAKPEQHAQNLKTAQGNNELKPGSKKAARMNMHLNRSMKPLMKHFKDTAPAQAYAKIAAASKPAHVDVDEPISGTHKTPKTTVTRSEHPTDKHDLGSTKAMKIVPKAV